MNTSRLHNTKPITTHHRIENALFHNYRTLYAWQHTQLCTQHDFVMPQYKTHIKFKISLLQRAHPEPTRTPLCSPLGRRGDTDSQAMCTNTNTYKWLRFVRLIRSPQRRCKHCERLLRQNTHIHTHINAATHTATTATRRHQSAHLHIRTHTAHLSPFC